MLYLFSSKPKTIESYFVEKGIVYELVDKDKYGVFLQTYIPQKGDWGLVYDFGKIIPESLLQNLLLLNIHFSLLPKYRGAVPVEAAILDGEPETGISIQKMVKGMDAGDILLQQTFSLDESWNSGQLQSYMDSQLPALLEKLFELKQADWNFVPQVGEPSFCYIKWLNRENAEIDFALLSSEEIVKRVRAYNPEPIAWTKVIRNGSQREMNILEATLYSEAQLEPKQLLFIKKTGLVVGTKSGTILLTKIVIAGSNELVKGDIVALKGSLSLL